MNQKTMKLMVMHKALYLSDAIDRVCVSRKEGERGLASIEYCITIWGLQINIKDQRKENFSSK